MVAVRAIFWIGLFLAAGCGSAPEPVLAPPPAMPQGPRDAASLDTTSAAERAAAIAPQGGETRVLGRTVASLGDPLDTGLWLATPLVSSVVEGRVEVVATGASATLELRPAESASRLSLAAMRLLDVKLTDLPEVEVHVR